MAKPRQPELSKELADKWGLPEKYHLILSDPDFIVYLDEELDIEWQTSPAWDEKYPADPNRHRFLVNRVAELEAAEWDYSDDKRTRNYKRQLAEVLANSFENDYENAEAMLNRVENYRGSILKAREDAIAVQITVKTDWDQHSNRWTRVHYIVGTTALLFSTFLAAKPSSFGLNEAGTQTVAWLVAFLTGLLTFLNPEKKASRYRRAWVILNNQIARYHADKSYKLDPVLSAHVEGQNLIAETTDKSGKQSITTQRRKAKSDAGAHTVKK
jgi:hypothetical protein